MVMHMCQHAKTVNTQRTQPLAAEESDWPMLNVEELSTYYPNQELEESTFQRASADGDVHFTFHSEPSTCFTANFQPGSSYQ